MHYEGGYNTTCGLCGKALGSRLLTNSPAPIMLRIARQNAGGKLICHACFLPVYNACSKLATEREIEEFEPQINQLIRKLEFKIPEDHDIKGHWLTLFDNELLGIVVNYERRD
jgi:hypothetical protein